MLYANSVLKKKKLDHENIAYQGAQGKRATKMVARPPGGVIHDYVPFVSTVEAVVAEGLDFVFYDHNATLDFATCFKNLADLDKIDWDLFFESPRLDGYCQYYFDNVHNPRYVRRKATRQAEFLVYKNFPLGLMNSVGVYSAQKRDEVQEIFDDADIDIPVEVKTAWYH